MLKNSEDAEYYTYTNNFHYDRYVVRDNAPYFSSQDKQLKNIVWVKCSEEQKINKAFIKKVLSAVEIESSEEYDVLFTEKAPSWLEVKKNYPNLQFLLSFGFRPREMGLQTQNQYNKWIYLEGKRLIFSQSIEVLEPDAQLKMQLWNQLKKLDRS